MLEGKNLYKDKSKYFSLIYLTSITGAYNLYLDKNKKATTMLLILFASIIMSYVTPICSLLDLTTDTAVTICRTTYTCSFLGFAANIIICIVDRIKGKKEIDKYNERIKSILINNSDCSEIFDIKCGSLKDYRLNILTFGLIGLDELYVEGCHTNSSRYNYIPSKLSSIRLTFVLLCALVSMAMCTVSIAINSNSAILSYIISPLYRILYKFIIVLVIPLGIIKSSTEYQVTPIVIVCIIIAIILCLDIRRKILKSEAIFSKYNNDIESSLFRELNKMYDIDDDANIESIAELTKKEVLIKEDVAIASNESNTNKKSDRISLFKDYNEYKLLLQFTGLTGAYNLYLDKKQKAIIMMIISVVSSILLLFQRKAISYACLGLLINGAIWILDFMKSKSDIDEYNKKINIKIQIHGVDGIRILKTKNKSDYKPIIAAFGFIGLDKFYLDKYDFKSIKSILFGLSIASHSYWAFMMSIIYILVKGDLDSAVGLIFMLIPILFIMLFICPVTVFVLMAGTATFGFAEMIFGSPFLIIALFLIAIDIYCKLPKADKLLKEHNNELEEYISNLQEEEQINQFDFL